VRYKEIGAEAVRRFIGVPHNQGTLYFATDKISNLAKSQFTLCLFNPYASTKNHFAAINLDQKLR